MARYSYQTRNSSGQVILQYIDAPNEVEARRKLKQQNIAFLKLQVQRGAGDTGNLGNKVSVSTKELLVFIRQFSTLINAGIPVADALKILTQSRRTEQLNKSLSSVRMHIENGKRLADAMALEPKVFSRFFINMVRAGEEAGVLHTVLDRLAAYLEQSEKLRRAVVSALVYPSIVSFVGVGVIWALLTFVIPIFKTLYANSNKALPALTNKLLSLSEFLNKNGLELAIGVLVFGVIFYYWSKSHEGRETIESTIIDLPLIGEVAQKSGMASLTRTLATLLSSGVGIIEALEISARTSGNIIIEKAVMRCRDAVTNGKTLASAMAKEKIFPEMTVQMIAVGEHSGTLDKMLSKIADFYEIDVENAVKVTLTFIEPLLLLVLGGVVAFILIAMYLPLFNLGSLGGT